VTCRAHILLLLVIAALAPACTHGDEVFAAKVVQVKDGDSVVLRADRVEYEARLGEIDAPEYDQAWGKSARKALSRLVKRQHVQVTVQDVDSYGRLVVQLRLPNSSVNHQLVADGHAWAYRDYLRDPKLLELEAQARQQGRGLWSQSGAVAPWLYRRGERRPTPADGTIAHLWNSVAASMRQVTRGFSCGRKIYCSQMNSCGEANFYLRHCGLTRLDGDSDGKPCERLCRAQRR
jgi:endonuclease YncB( thermonuclease family)